MVLKSFYVANKSVNYFTIKGEIGKITSTYLDLQLECQIYPILSNTHYASLVIITCLKAAFFSVSVD